LLALVLAYVLCVPFSPSLTSLALAFLFPTSLALAALASPALASLALASFAALA